MKAYMFLLAAVLVAGCVNNASQGTALTVQADPHQVFSEGSLRVFINIENRDSKPIDNIYVSLFDKSVLRGNICEKRIARMLPSQASELRCIFTAPEPDQASQRVDLHVKAEFDAAFSAAQGISMIKEDEYRRQKATGSLKEEPASYSHRDRNLEMVVEFNENLPLIVRPEKDYFMYITLVNVGEGFISNIEERDFKIIQPGSVVQCVPFGKLEVTGDSFPRITCKLTMPDRITYLTNYDVIISVDYHYELRQSESITLLK